MTAHREQVEAGEMTAGAIEKLCGLLFALYSHGELALKRSLNADAKGGAGRRTGEDVMQGAEVQR